MVVVAACVPLKQGPRWIDLDCLWVGRLSGSCSKLDLTCVWEAGVLQSPATVILGVGRRGLSGVEVQLRSR